MSYRGAVVAASTPFSISISGSPPVVQLGGDVDLACAEELTAALEPLLQPGADPTVVFDLAEVTFLDSSGLAVLVTAAGAGKQVVLRNASAVVARIIAVTGLDQVLTLES